MDRGPRAGHQLLRHRQRLRLEQGEGITEQIIGRWFAKGGGRREKTVLATKLYGAMGDWPNDAKLSALNIRRACDACSSACRPTTSTSTSSTTSTGTPRGTRSGRPWTSCAQQGKILYVGSSNFAGWHIAQAQEARPRRGSIGLVSEQCHLQPARPGASSWRCCPPRRTTASA